MSTQCPIAWLLPLIALLPGGVLHAAPPPPENPELKAFVRSSVANFHQRRIERLSALKLETVLARKNPYLLKAKSLNSPRALVVELLNSHLTPQESAIFGTVMEQVAIEVCRKTYGGRKSAIQGIDMEFDRDSTRYLVSIKSGPNWGNSSQIKKMRDDFRRAKKTLGTNTDKELKVVAINGCCYGTTPSEDRGDYVKLCGKNFWFLISGNDKFYLNLIHLIGDESAQQEADFKADYEKVLRRFLSQFRKSYCNPDGDILWEKIVELNSGDQ